MELTFADSVNEYRMRKKLARIEAEALKQIEQFKSVARKQTNMKPIEFEGQTRTLSKPNNMTDEECQLLPITDMNGTIVSCWKVQGWKERLKLLFTGKVWLGVLSGHTQPPVFVAVDRPFNVVSGNV